MSEARDPVAPLTIGPQNCAAVVGQPWRWTRDTAKRLSVPVWTIGGKSAIPAAALLDALRREGERSAPAVAPVAIDDDEAEREAVRARLGIRRA